jgi:hypothetical protein
MLSTIESETKTVVKDLEKLINLSNISKREQFQLKIEEFFEASNPNQLLLIFADMQTDSKNRINMCRSIINN